MEEASMKRKFAVWAVFCLVTLFFSACSDSSNNEVPKETVHVGLETLRALANSGNHAFFGYLSRDEIGTEELREPFEVKFLNIEALKSDPDPAANIDDLIEKKSEMIYPVHVQGKISTSIKLALEDNEYKVVSIGSLTLVNDFMEMTKRLGLTVNDCFLLEIPGTELCFVGSPEDGPFTVTPLYDNSAMGLESGMPLSLASIADALKQYCIEEENQYELMVPRSEAGEYEPELHTADTEPPSSVLLNVTLYPQQQDQWCWAASGRMTMVFAGGDPDKITQCAEANDAFSQTACCSNGASTDCNIPYFPLYQNWGFDFSLNTNDDGKYLIDFPFELLKQELSKEHPIAFLWRWASSGGHYQVAIGYSEDTSKDPPDQFVNILNPWPVGVGDTVTIPYSIWLKGSSDTIADHELRAAFYDIKKN